MFLKISNCGVTMLEHQERIRVTEAAEIMGVSSMFLRMGLRQNRFPFGTAVFMKKRWAYYIHPVKFKAYMEGKEVEEQKVEAMDG